MSFFGPIQFIAEYAASEISLLDITPMIIAISGFIVSLLITLISARVNHKNLLAQMEQQLKNENSYLNRSKAEELYTDLLSLIFTNNECIDTLIKLLEKKQFDITEAKDALEKCVLANENTRKALSPEETSIQHIYLSKEAAEQFPVLALRQVAFFPVLFEEVKRAMEGAPTPYEKITFITSEEKEIRAKTTIFITHIRTALCISSPFAKI